MMHRHGQRLGEIIDAAKAEAWGLVEEVVPAAKIASGTRAPPRASPSRRPRTA